MWSFYDLFKRSNKLKLSVVIPAYNEINTIEEIIYKVQEVDLEKEIIIVDDCNAPQNLDR